MKNKSLQTLELNIKDALQKRNKSKLVAKNQIREIRCVILQNLKKDNEKKTCTGRSGSTSGEKKLKK